MTFETVEPDKEKYFSIQSEQTDIPEPRISVFLVFFIWDWEVKKFEFCNDQTEYREGLCVIFGQLCKSPYGHFKILKWTSEELLFLTSVQC